MTVLLIGGPANQVLAAMDQNSRQLITRLETWPAWSTPAPLPRPRPSDDLVYPDWFEGAWDVESIDLLTDGQQDNIAKTLHHQARFQRNLQNAVVGDRLFNATSVGQALLGGELLSVEQAPQQVNRQLARLSNDRLLESTVIGRLQTSTDSESFLSDEVVLQVMHGARAPRLSRIETLSRYRPCPKGSTDNIVDRICGAQWQRVYPAPGATNTTFAPRGNRYGLTLTRRQDPSPAVGPPVDHALRIRVEVGDDH